MLVIKFTTVIFTVILSPLFLPPKFSPGKFFIACFQVVGNVLVIQPPLLFPDDNKRENYPQYWLGFSIALGYALFSTISVIIIFRLKKHATLWHLLFWQSVGFAPSIPVLVAMGRENRIFTDFTTISPIDWLLIWGAVALFTIKLICIINASKLAEPVIPNSVRLVEIPVGIFLEAIFFTDTPNYLSVIGSIIVISSACVITCYDKIKAIVCKSKSNVIEPNDVNDKTEETAQTEL